jgi:lipoprotein-anchoring transpeptidase ErfK/SrfK
MKRRHTAWLAVLLLTGACDPRSSRETATVEPDPAPERPGAVQVMYDRGERVDPEELERQRLDMDWMQVVDVESPEGGDGPPNPERWEEITTEAVNGQRTHLPLHGDVAGPSVLRAQILLDRALFSPGIMDGRWGKNSAASVYWFQRRHGLRATARVDSATFTRLMEEAGRPQRLVVEHRLTQDDVAGPFTEIPEDIYEHARLDCSCYESLAEKLSEMFHSTPELLERLNPGVDLNGLRAGQSLNVPDVRGREQRARGSVAKLVVSGRGRYVQAHDAQGNIVYHFPSTLGARYSPSPQGDFRITGVARDPDWLYQPRILHGIDDDDEEALIPPGPNLPVGTVWMALNQPHYGIHGTNKPETIGYATSNGCVRLTNWDAEFLASQVRPGIDVEFRDIEGHAEQPEPAPDPTTRGSASPTRTAPARDTARPAPAAGSGAARDTAARDTAPRDTAPADTAPRR